MQHHSSSANQAVVSQNMLNFMPLKCHQGSAMEKNDAMIAAGLAANSCLSSILELPANDATNACMFIAFLVAEQIQQHPQTNVTMSATVIEAAERVILNFPAEINRLRDKSLSYDVLEALRIISQVNQDSMFTASNIIQPAVFEQCSLVSIWAKQTAKSVTCFILVCQQYVFLMVCNNTELLLLDTHAVSETFGGNKNGLLVISSNDVLSRYALNNWIYQRVSGNGKHCIYYEVYKIESVAIASRSPTNNQASLSSNIVEENQQWKVQSEKLESETADAACNGVNNSIATQVDLVQSDQSPQLISVSASRPCVVSSSEKSESGSACVEVSQTEVAVHAVQCCNFSASGGNECDDSGIRPNMASSSSNIQHDIICEDEVTSVTNDNKELHDKIKSKRPLKRVGSVNNSKFMSPSLWDNCEPEEVDSIPYDINGLRKFLLVCEKKDMMKVSKDGRPWSTWMTSSRRNFNGIRRLAVCNGSFRCDVTSCQLKGQPNTLQFHSVNGRRRCSICGIEATFVPCCARKVWEYSEGQLCVMYYGDHTCSAKPKTVSRTVINRAVAANPGVSPTKIVLDNMVSLICEDNINWGSVERVANDFVNIKRIHNAKADIMDKINKHGNSFDAVCLLKRESDKRDKFLIYKLNNGCMNNGQPTYVFKSSEAMAKLALDMNCDKEGELNNCFAHVDAKHDRVINMKTITLWTYHPTVRRILRIAVMDVSCENAENLVLFWTILNDMLKEVSGDAMYIFNPRGWVVDENSANWQSIQTVFGANAIKRTVSCEFHYKQSLQKHSHKVEQSTEFKRIGTNMLEAYTEKSYMEAYENMVQFSKEHNSVLDAWLSWWHKRRKHIFRAFKPLDAPNINLAEIGHAQMANTGESKMLMIRACRIDIANSFRQEAVIQAFYTGQCPPGRGPTQAAVKAASHKRQMRIARKYAENLSDCEHDDEPFVAKRCKHRPPNQGKKRKLSADYDENTKCKKQYKTMGTVACASNRFELPPLSELQLQTQKLQPVTLCFTPSSVKKCFGCNKKLCKKPSPEDLVLRKRDFRVYKHADTWVRRDELQNTYYHLDMCCVRLNFPYLSAGDIVVHDDIKQDLSGEHLILLHNAGVHVACAH
jgi:hypothetical protein